MSIEVITNWKKIIAELKLKKRLEIYSTFYENREDNEERYYLFNEEIIKIRENNNFVAVTDNSVKDDNMGGVWIIMDTDRKFEVYNEIYHEKWDDNTSGVAKVIVLLESVTVLDQRGRYIENNKIRIRLNNKIYYHKIADKIKKSNEYAQEAGVEISMIKKKISEIKFHAEIE